VLHDVIAQVITYTVGVPHRTSQQVLHAIGAGLPGVLGDRPAILARQIGQQPQHESPGPSPRLDPRKPAGHPTE
jgi:hypothetical protein